MSMSERLQIILDARDVALVRQTSARAGQSVSEWVRGLIRRQFAKHPPKKADLLKTFGQLELPAPPIDRMLSEIEKGRK